MKEKKDIIKVDMIRVAGDAAPFILVAYVDKDANEHQGVMLIDSGSGQNILSCEMTNQLAPLCKREGETSSITTVSSDVVTMNKVNFSFVMGGKQFHEVFCISGNVLPVRKLGNFPVVGVLGNYFLLKHGLVIDFSDYTLHTSTITEDNFSISDCEFFFPMEKGMKYFGLPIVLLSNSEEAALAIADTGASHNQIASLTIDELGMDCNYLGEKDLVEGIGGSIEAEEAHVKFNLGSLTEDGGVEIPCQEPFKVSPNFFLTPKEGHCDENGEQLPPLEALIGSPFMAREKWVLDFDTLIIYKLREKNKLWKAV